MDNGRKAISKQEVKLKEIKPDDEELIAYGAEVKALGDGKIGGYLIRYTTKADPDLTNDYFDVQTDIQVPETLPLLYNHGLDKTLKKRVIGMTTTKMDEVGVWAESQMNMRDEYEKAIYEMAKAGKLGYSSGALSHLVEREPAGKAMHIKTWFVGESSITPMPAEFRNTVVTLKSLTTPEQAALTDTDESKTNKENKNMDENDVNKAVEAALAKRDAEAKAAADRAAEIKAAEDAGAKKAIEELKAKGQLRAPVYIPSDKMGDDNDGKEAFKAWIRTGQENHSLITADSSWDKNAAKTAFNITTGASGSFLVPDILYSQIQPVRDLASFIRQAPVQVFQTPADHLFIPATDTKHTAFTLTAESAAYTENEATVKQVDAKLYKYTKEVVMTEEFIAYNQTNFDAWLVQELGRAEAVTENSLYATGGGGTTIEGVTTNATAGNTVATTAVWAPSDITGLIGSLGGGYNIMGQCGFLTTNANKWYLKGLGTSTFPWFISTPSAGPSNAAQGGGPIGEPGVLGYPIFLSDSVGAYTSTSATAKALTFGNWNFYALLERPGMMVQRNPYLLMATGQIALFASIYRGGIPIQAEAFIYLVQKS